jgi:hypothetical protein
MPRTIAITTLWTAAWRESNVNRSCPGEHQLPDRPDVHHVITRRVDNATAAAYLAEHDITLRPGQVLGSVPQRMSPSGYLVSTLVTDPDELAAFGDLMAPDEQLGTVPAAGRPPILLTEAELGDLIDAHHRSRGDVLFHREGLPHYDVPSQNADRAAWLAGRFDPAQVTAWTARLADERERGMVSQRLRVLSERLTDDELMSVLAALPVIAREEQVRILRRGEHPIPKVVDHDYWIARPAIGPVLVIRMHYTDGGAFQGAEVVPPQGHAPYLRDQELGWAIGVPYAEWMSAHSDLQTGVA